MSIPVLQMTLRSARVNRGLTQAEACVLIGVSRGTLRNWEKGKTFPKQYYIEKICEVYQLSYDNILFAK